MKKKGITNLDQKEKGQICSGRNSLSGCGHRNPGAGTGDRFEGRRDELKLGDLDCETLIRLRNLERPCIWWKTQSRCQSLGQASAEQTKGKIFRLKQDLEIGIKSAATGTFAGTFDGDGHVIKINHLAINGQHTGDRGTGSISGCALWYGVRNSRKSDH